MTQIIYILSFISLLTFSAYGQDITITQKDKKFSQKEIIVKKGQKITFINDDNLAHNVYTIVDGKKVDLGLQKAGESGELTFEDENTYRVRCAIHPRMKMIVKVE
ncbi:MAG: hypothetical protein HOH19_06450 [Kordiimonadaceae bacterium]|jgi:plastocyanin|nr:hypothetical protein [Kordiimonadaceae bacterium]